MDLQVPLPSSPPAENIYAGVVEDADGLADRKKKLEAMLKVMDSQITFFKPFLPLVAIRLRIPEILGHRGLPLTAPEIAEALDRESPPNLHNLRRILRALVVDEYLLQQEDQELDEDVLLGQAGPRSDEEAAEWEENVDAGGQPTQSTFLTTGNVAPGRRRRHREHQRFVLAGDPRRGSEPRFSLSILGEALLRAAPLGSGRDLDIGLVDSSDADGEESAASLFLRRAYSYSHLHEAVLSPVVVPLEKASAAGPQLMELFGNDGDQATALFTRAMVEASNLHLTIMLPNYYGFRDVVSVVDVGGADGCALEIIREHNPHIEGINFDLREVVAAAPPIPGIRHVEGDMFQSIPTADAVYLKWILHELSDDECLRVLANCKAALSPDCMGRKVIIQDTIVPPMTEPDKDRLRSAIYMDLAMMANTRGYQRTEAEWRSLLLKAGFGFVTVLQNNSVHFCILEALPGF